MRKTPWKLIGLAAVWSASLATVAVCGHALAAAPVAAGAAEPQVPSLETIFRAEPYRGQNAKEMAFSRSGRYLAYLWNPFETDGFDLHVHDSRSGQTLRITSQALMALAETPEALDRYSRKAEQRKQELSERQQREVAQQAYLQGRSVDLEQWDRQALAQLKLEQAQKKKIDEARKALDKAEDEAEQKAAAALAARRAKSATPAASAATVLAAAASAASAPAAEENKQDWEWRDELAKSREKNKLKPEDLYPGVSQLVWANERDELIFQYRGQLFRWVAGKPGFERLSVAARELQILAYTPDDKGYLFKDDSRVLRASFADASVQVLNAELVHPDDAERKYKIESTSIAENGRWMALTTQAPLLGPDGKALPPKAARQVEVVSYSERFASVKRHDRELADDHRSLPPQAIYIRPVPGLKEGPLRQSEPVFSHKGGDVWFELGPVVWTRDASHYAFVTWEREKELLRVYLGRPEAGAKPAIVLERRGDVHAELEFLLSPQFTPDGKQLVVHLAESGFRQPYALDLKTQQLRPLLKGNFEALEVLGFTPDSRSFFVAANRDDPAAMNLFRVDAQSGAMTALGQAEDYHRKSVASFNGQWLAGNAGHWGQPPELKLIKGMVSSAAPSQVLTQSHDPAFAKVLVQTPDRFSFKNRHGDDIQGYVFKPKGWQASDKRPAVVYVYGGPLGDSHIVERDSFQATAYLFSMYMAAKHGYVTVTVDPRGHSNYGQRFSSANWQQPGKPQTEDLQDAVAYIEQNFGVDRQRIGLNGWSFGGFQTQYTLYTQPDLFAAGIAGAGPTEWENYNSWYTGLTIAKADRNKPLLRQYSLLPLAKNLKKPLLLVHGMQDSNVLFQDTVNVYRALLLAGKESLVELFLDPDGGHGLGGAVKNAGWHRKYEAFWLQHLGMAETTKPGSVQSPAKP